jgi:TolA-binding protein
MNTKAEREGLLQVKSGLIVDKREHETQLVLIKNAVRSGGRLSTEKYRRLCDTQNTHNRAILAIEKQLVQVNTRLRELAEIDNQNAEDRRTDSREMDEKPIVQELVAIRQEYQNFAADGTRVASMRRMASEFVTKLNPIIKRAVGSA